MDSWMWKVVLSPFTKEETLTLLVRLQGVWCTKLHNLDLGHFIDTKMFTRIVGTIAYKASQA
jgi:hypothetical protein